MQAILFLLSAVFLLAAVAAESADPRPSFHDSVAQDAKDAFLDLIQSDSRSRLEVLASEKSYSCEVDPEKLEDLKTKLEAAQTNGENWEAWDIENQLDSVEAITDQDQTPVIKFTYATPSHTDDCESTQKDCGWWNAICHAGNLARMATCKAANLLGDVVFKQSPQIHVEFEDVSCKRRCKAGKACGNSCISATKTCHKETGTACNSDDPRYIFDTVVRVKHAKGYSTDNIECMLDGDASKCSEIMLSSSTLTWRSHVSIANALRGGEQMEAVLEWVNDDAESTFKGICADYAPPTNSPTAPPTAPPKAPSTRRRRGGFW